MPAAGAAVSNTTGAAGRRPSAPSRSPPICAETGEGRRLGFLKLVAGMLGVGLDELVQRDDDPPAAAAGHRRRRHRSPAWPSTSGLAVTAIQARDAARDQRREAEGLVAFMLGDLGQARADRPARRARRGRRAGARLLPKQDKEHLVGREPCAAFEGADPDGRDRQHAQATSTALQASTARRWRARRKPCAENPRPAAPVRPRAERVLGRRYRLPARPFPRGRGVDAQLQASGRAPDRLRIHRIRHGKWRACTPTRTSASCSGNPGAMPRLRRFLRIHCPIERDWRRARRMIHNIAKL